MSGSTLTPRELLAAPWVQPVWQQFQAVLHAGRLPHALLLGGAAGLGQELLAESLQAALICTAPTAQGLACEQCRACHLRLQGAHADVHLLQPAEGKASIGVDQVRELGEALQYAPQRGPRRVARVQPAEALSVAACNALLKTLEEPIPGAVLLLVSAQPRALLPTLRSRCVQWLLPLPAADQAQEWLAAHGLPRDQAAWQLARSHGAPLAALALSASSDTAAESWATLLLQWLEGAPGAHAAEWVKRERTRAEALARWLETLLTLAAQPRRVALPGPIQRGVDRLAALPPERLYPLTRSLWQLQRWSGSGVRLDLQLLQVLQDLRRLCHPAVPA